MHKERPTLALLRAVASENDLTLEERIRLWTQLAPHVRALERTRLDGTLCWITGQVTPRQAVYQCVRNAQIDAVKDLLKHVGTNAGWTVHKGVEFTESLFAGYSTSLHGDIDILAERYTGAALKEALESMGYSVSALNIKSGALVNPPLDTVAHSFNLGSLSKVQPLDLTGSQMASIGRWVRPVWTDLTSAKVVLTFDLAVGLDAHITSEDFNIQRGMAGVGGLSGTRCPPIEDRFWYTLCMVSHSLLSNKRIIKGAKVVEAIKLFNVEHGRICWDRVAASVIRFRVHETFLPMLCLLSDLCNKELPVSLKPLLKGSAELGARTEALYNSIST